MSKKSQDIVNTYADKDILEAASIVQSKTKEERDAEKEAKWNKAMSLIREEKGLLKHALECCFRLDVTVSIPIPDTKAVLVMALEVGGDTYGDEMKVEVDEHTISIEWLPGRSLFEQLLLENFTASENAYDKLLAAPEIQAAIKEAIEPHQAALQMLKSKMKLLAKQNQLDECLLWEALEDECW